MASQYSSGRHMSKLIAPPMTYIAGEEMTHHCMKLILKNWIEPNVDTRFERRPSCHRSRDRNTDIVFPQRLGVLRSVLREP